MSGGATAGGPAAVGRPAAFIDRDGVINVEVGFLHRIEQFAFLPGAVEALQRMRAVCTPRTTTSG
jgi:histidinol phosphatase-like enzyme